jgi:hypothetical protein
MLDENQLLEVSSRVEAASPGPWKAFVEGRDHVSGSSFIRVGDGPQRRVDIELSGAIAADYDFIAHARQDIPLLVDEVRRLSAVEQPRLIRRSFARSTAHDPRLRMIAGYARSA